jgi:hypothetical protein
LRMCASAQRMLNTSSSGRPCALQMPVHADLSCRC